MKTTKLIVANSIDGANENIPNHFMEIYSKLYNTMDDAENMDRVKSEVETKVDGLSLNDVGKVTSEMILLNLNQEKLIITSQIASRWTQNFLLLNAIFIIFLILPSSVLYGKLSLNFNFNFG